MADYRKLTTITMSAKLVVYCWLIISVLVIKILQLAPNVQVELTRLSQVASDGQLFRSLL